MKRIILASESPRRRELMAMMNIPFTTKASLCDEYLDTSLPLEQAIEHIAVQKAEAAIPQFPDDLIIGADTVVCIDGEVLGKPHDEETAFSMLKKLSGKTHKVITGVAIITPQKREIFHVCTDVTFFPLTDKEIHAYVATKEPLDKAGAYGIQGKGAFLVEKINGDYYNIVGLPISTLYRRLENCMEM